MAIQREYGAVTAAFNWYRAANIASKKADKAFKKNILRPTLFIWGTEDRVIVPEIIPLQKNYIKAPYQELSVKSGHSLMQAKTDSITIAILNHFRK